MNKKLGLFFIIMVLAVSILTINSHIFAASGVVQTNGQLKVLDGKLCNSSGNPIQLKGMSSHGLQWYPFSNNTVDSLVNNLNVTVVRAAMYTDPYYDGYIKNPDSMKSRVKLVVDRAIADGVYVIIDWHICSDNNPNTYKEQARAFFDEMSKTYGNYSNVIYEICNEPNNCSWSNDIKPYANYIIPVIRNNDPDSVIVVGTENWSTGLRTAADSPLSFGNVLYTLHFYAASHGASLRADADYAISKGLGIFVTEWGTCEASGSGTVDLNSSQLWVDWMKSNNISWCNWNMGNKDESSSMLKPNVSMDGPWDDTQLTISGAFVKSKIIDNTVPSFDPNMNYKIVLRNNPDYCLDCTTPYGNGTKLQMWQYVGNDRQQWKLVDVGNGYYKIVLRNNPSYCLDCTTPYGNGTNIQMWQYVGNDRQQWKIDAVGGGNYKILLRNNLYYCIDCTTPYGNGTLLQMFGYCGTDREQWQIVPVGY